MKTAITNVKIVDGLRTRTDSAIIFEDDKILDIVPADNLKADRVIDGKGLYATAGFIDIHTHGAGGGDFMDGTTESFEKACLTHLEHGTTTIIPTTLSASAEELNNSIKAYREVKESLSDRISIPGLHLEGPYFAMAQKGGQDPKYVRDPNPEEYRSIVEKADGAIIRWSIAPELPGACEMADYLLAHNIIPTMGHTNATYPEVVEAMKHGYRHITHLYSCTSTITRRDGFRILGVTESAYCFDELTAELITDGCHLPPELIAMIVKCKGADKLCMITDSLRPAGLDVKESISGSLENGQKCIIEDGVAKLPDHTAFAGSIATTDRLVRTVWKMAGISLETTIQMMCENPARFMNIKDKGRLLPSYDADIVLFDENVNVKTVIHKGKIVSGGLV